MISEQEMMNTKRKKALNEYNEEDLLTYIDLWRLDGQQLPLWVIEDIEDMRPEFYKKYRILLE